jgi:hypothetical protein
LLGWAHQGLRILIVHGAREAKLVMRGEYTRHERAAARTPGLDGRDQELADTIAARISLPNVAEIEDPALTLTALRKLGVRGRAEFAETNRNLLTHLREDGDLHLYAYHFVYETGEPTVLEVSLPEPGVVYRIDAWNGAIRPHRGVRLEGDKAIVILPLAPGETAMITVDRWAARSAESEPPRYEQVAELSMWDISVESWDAGALELFTEDRGLGYVTPRFVRPGRSPVSTPGLETCGRGRRWTRPGRKSPASGMLSRHCGC